MNKAVLFAFAALAVACASADTYKFDCAFYKEGGLPCPQSKWPEALYRPLPAFALSNWADSIITWVGSRASPNDKETRAPGINGYSTSAAWGKSAVTLDSFALTINGEILGDPKQFDGDAQLFPSDGSFRYLVRTYKGRALPVRVTRTIVVPPGEPFVLVRYTLENANGSVPVSVGLLDFVQGAECQQGADSQYDAGTSSFQFNRARCGPHYFVHGAFASSAGALTFETSASVVSSYASAGKLNGNSKYSGNTPQTAFAVTPAKISPGQRVTVDFYRVLVTDTNRAAEARKRVLSKSADAWAEQCKQSTTAWLASGVQPKTDDALLRSYFQVSILAMKHSQNPTLGTFVASFHECYLFKVWARDAAFSAMIMDAAGYHAEAEKFLVWLASAQLRDGNPSAFHTCYSWYTGEPVGFVEPQYDSAGAALAAFYFHARALKDDTAAKNFVSKIFNRARDLERFLIDGEKANGLVAPDYSIWEESSDGRTGASLETSYFTFTQSMAFSGLQSAALLESKWGDGNRAAAATKRAEEIRSAIERQLWIESAGHYARSAEQRSFRADPRVDGSTAAAVFTGASTNATRSASHLRAIRASLTKQGSGIARYENDPFFFDSLYSPGGRETGEASPPWGVVTMFVSWAELSFEGEASRPQVLQRLRWMVEHAALGMMPSGEAVDGVSGAPVMASCPDLYEHAGVYAWTLLMFDGVAPLPNPNIW